VPIYFSFVVAAVAIVDIVVHVLLPPHAIAV
jgi:hypothetical protein